VAHPGDGLARQRLDVVEACRTSIERDCQGGPISTGVVESTGHQGGRKPMVTPSPLAGRPRGAPRLRPAQTQVFNEAWAAAWRPWVLGVRTPAG
jgi:hypothetical protein